MPFSIRGPIHFAVAGLAASLACARPVAPPAPTPTRSAAGVPAAAQDTATRRPASPAAMPGRGPRPYATVVTPRAVTRRGLFVTHRVDERLLFEVPRREFGREILMIQRPIETADPFAWFNNPNMVQLWEREGDFVVVRQRTYSVRADSAAPIALAVSGMIKGPVLARLPIEAWSEDSAAVVDVTALFTGHPEFSGLAMAQRDRSWIERVLAAERTVDVEATVTGQVRAPNAPPTAPPQSVTTRMAWSFYRLAERPMMPRLQDRRVGFIGFTTIDYGRDDHRAEQRRYIHRHRLEKRDPNATISDPVEPIVYWIDAATPAWLKPYVKQGVDDWQEAFREAGFSNAIEGRFAPSPSEDPEWSNTTLGKSVIYWRPSTIPNATGGQVVDPRSGEIIKGEVNMYHNIMAILRNTYFIQASPNDPRARSLEFPDPLMGRLVRYVVAHEIGHAIGFPHNMKASYAYHPDSLRSVHFLRRMRGHVSTLMDYSRFNYVAQPEDSIPVELLVPQIGPYDKFAVMWGYKPIPGARTPDEEWPTLDQWSRVQDSVPWLRFSTNDAPNDPGFTLEAVGDMDPVYSSTLALQNLRRVVESLLPVAERPGQDYTQLRELYDDAVGQWSLYLNHVAQTVGGADAEERYGTGVRFRPVNRERQQRAMRFLVEQGFTVPSFLIAPEILRRVEAVGALPRLRNAQVGVVRGLVAKTRLDRLLEYEALAGGSPGYTATDLLSDLRRGIWGELSRGSVRIDVYRRNLQRAYLEAVGAELRPPAAPAGPQNPFLAAQAQARWASDARPLLRGELREIDRLAAQGIVRAGDALTRLHLEDVRAEIAKMLRVDD